MEEATVAQTKSILRARLHMYELPGNFKQMNQDSQCYLCGEKEAITEHFFNCKPTSEIRRNWNVREEDLKSKETFTLTKVGKFLRYIEDLFTPKMKGWKDKPE